MRKAVAEKAIVFITRERFDKQWPGHDHWGKRGAVDLEFATFVFTQSDRESHELNTRYQEVAEPDTE